MSEHTEEITIAGVSNSNEPKWLIDVNKSKTDALCAMKSMRYMPRLLRS